MHPQVVQPAPWQSVVMPLLVMAVVLGLRWRSLRRLRRLRVEMLWVLPAIYAVAAAVLFFEFPPSAMGWLWTGLAAIAGAAIGWQRGRMMRITIDPQTHELSQQGSPAAFLLLVALILARRLGAYEFSGAGHVTMLVTDIGLGFGIGLIGMTRLEMTLRARRMLREAQAA